MKGGYINLWGGGIILGLAEDACCALLEPGLPIRDLVGMHIKVLRKLGKGLIALQSGQCHLGFKGRCVVPARSSAHLLSSFRHFRRLGNRTSTYPAVRISETGSEFPAYGFCNEAWYTAPSLPGSPIKVLEYRIGMPELTNNVPVARFLLAPGSRRPSGSKLIGADKVRRANEHNDFE